MYNDASWYQELIRPEWAPPSWVFSPVWTVLYILIAISFGYVVYLFYKKVIPASVILPFILNLIFNFAYTPLQFGLQNLALASIDILFVLATMVWAGVMIWPYARWVALINIPYFLWVSFATVLQLTIFILN
jgi:tryptophan-rich sensory protein